MKKRILFTIVVSLMGAGILSAQQAPDLKYKPPLPRPAYESGKGPRVAIDEAHRNFHTAEGRYKPFAELLKRDGYRVDAQRQTFSAKSLKGLDVLVISNALPQSNDSAFTKDEIAALHSWVEKGGSLFLIADHPPFASAAGELAKAFKVEWCNGHARAGHWKEDGDDTFEVGTGLKESIITRGRAGDEKVTKIATFAGSAFKPPKDAIPILEFGSKSKAQARKVGEKGQIEWVEIPIEGWCQGAVMNVGKGRVALSGEAAMFSAQVVPDLLWSWEIKFGEMAFRMQVMGQERFGMNIPPGKQNHQLLLNVMHWLSRAKGMAD